MKQPWWLTILQVVTLTCLSGLALYDAVTDHGVLMAINCFCVGFLWYSVIASRFMAKMSLALDAQTIVVIDMARLITEMTEERFPSIQPGNETDRDGPTKH